MPDNTHSIFPLCHGDNPSYFRLSILTMYFQQLRVFYRMKAHFKEAEKQSCVFLRGNYMTCSILSLLRPCHVNKPGRKKKRKSQNIKMKGSIASSSHDDSLSILSPRRIHALLCPHPCSTGFNWDLLHVVAIAYYKHGRLPCL